MVTAIKRYMAKQARSPFGLFGKVVAPRVYNRENKDMEDFGMQVMDPKPDDRILEIGFGNGRLMSEILPDINRGEVHGIDISDAMIEAATERNRKWIEKGKLTLRNASVENIPYPDGSFDKVFTCNTIYFWPEPQKNLEEVKRVLDSGGRFITAMRTKEEMESRGSLVLENTDLFHNLYTREQVNRLFSSAGFGDISFHAPSDGDDSYFVIKAIK